MEKKSILLDVDEVICFPKYLDVINEFLGTSYEIDDFTDYYIDEASVPKERMSDYISFLHGKNLYDGAQLIPNAREVIEALNDRYEISICSSCVDPFDKVGSGKRFMEKYDYLVSTLPFLQPEGFIFTSKKRRIKADIQIDDRLPNLDPMIERRILFPSYHNGDISQEELARLGVEKAGSHWSNGWEEVSNMLLDEADRPKILRK